jgi:hypothetical protein
MTKIKKTSFFDISRFFYSAVHLLSKLSRTHSKSSNDDFEKFKQCERVILNLG